MANIMGTLPSCDNYSIYARLPWYPSGLFSIKCLLFVWLAHVARILFRCGLEAAAVWGYFDWSLLFV